MTNHLINQPGKNIRPKIKIVIVNSMPLIKRGNKLFIYKETGKFVNELADNEEVEVTFFQFSMESVKSDFLADFPLTTNKLKIIGIKRKRSKMLAYLNALLKAVPLVIRHDFCYLFYPSNIFFEIIAICFVLANKKIGLYVRGQQNLDSRIAKFLFKKSEIINTISPQFTNVIKKFNNKTFTIRPMMDFDEDDIVYKRLYAKREKFNILFVGRIEKAKGVFDLIKAIKSLINKGIDNFTLNLVGDGEDKTNIEKLISDLSLHDFVIMHGTITNKDKLKSYYLNSDVFVLPTHHEGFPRVLYESMIFGIPIITTSVGSIGHLMRDNYNCRIIEPHDPQNISKVLLNVMENYEKASSLTKNGIDTIQKYLSDKKDPHSIHLLKHLF